jgi:hypothetical protein
MSLTIESIVLLIVWIRGPVNIQRVLWCCEKRESTRTTKTQYNRTGRYATLLTGLRTLAKYADAV